MLHVPFSTGDFLEFFFNHERESLFNKYNDILIAGLMNEENTGNLL